MQRSHLLFLLTVGLAFSCIYTTYYAFFLSTKKFSNITEFNVLDKENKEWFNHTSKVVMLLIDGFRFDYLVYGDEDPTVLEQHPYKNKFKQLYEIVNRCPECFTALRAHADPPTWTWERIPGLVTGNIPPKASMFQLTKASRAIEDTVLHQVKLAGKKAYFAGDPLWTDYFPDDLIKVANVRGYDLKDTAVDDETIDSMAKLLKENQFDIIIGHVLEVDHASHLHGLYDSRVGEQLAIVDKWVANFINLMDDDTTLIILGDHGTTVEGTHGAGSPGETDTIIAAYHKKGFQKYHNKGTAPIMRSINETVLQIKQQDLASTLSMLLGVPLPFSNVGQIIDDMYPAGQFQDKPDCQGEAFLTKMLNDNYLNTAQVMHYYTFFQAETQLFSDEIHQTVQSLAQDAFSAYKEAIAMTDNGQQCGEPFAEKVTEAILIGQKLSTEIYQVILNKTSYDMLVIIQGMISIVLVMIAYALIIQYLHVHGYEKQNDEIQDRMEILKVLITPGLVILAMFLITWMMNGNPIHFMTTATVFASFWLVGNLSVYTFKNGFQRIQQSNTESANGIKSADDNQKDLDNVPLELNDVKSHLEASDLQEGDYETGNNSRNRVESQSLSSLSVLWNLRTLFVFYTPLLSISAVILVVLMIFFLHQSIFELFIGLCAKDYSPHATLFLAAFRINSLFFKRYFYILMTLSGALILFIVNIDLVDLQALRPRLILGLLLMGDWIASEIRHVSSKFGATQVWGYVQAACFFVIVVYQMMNKRETYLIEIVLPRTVWALVICLCAFKNVFKIQGPATLRNLELCLVQFLLLLEDQKTVFPFAITLTLMRVTTYLLSRYLKPSNYLFSFAMVMESYFGFFFLGQTDRIFPLNFNAGFIGLHDFNPVLSALMIFMNVTSGFILGMLFVSYYNQDLDAQNPENRQVGSLGSDEMSKKNNLRITARVMKKRNIIIFILLIGIAYIGAFIKCLAWKDYLLWETKYKYIMDGCIYIFFMMWGSASLALE